jgi:hypothetical protein
MRSAASWMFLAHQPATSLHSVYCIQAVVHAVMSFHRLPLQSHQLE